MKLNILITYLLYCGFSILKCLSETQFIGSKTFPLDSYDHQMLNSELSRAGNEMLEFDSSIFEILIHMFV